MRPLAKAMLTFTGLLVAAAGLTAAGAAEAEETYVSSSIGLTGVTLTGTAFSPDGSRLYEVTDEAAVHVVDTASGKEVPGFTLPQAWYGSPSISPDGRRMVFASDEFGLSLRDATTGDEIWNVKPQRQVISKGFSGDGQRIVASLADGSASILDAATGKEIATLANLSGTLATIAKLDGDGNRLLTAASRSVSIRDVASGRKILSVDLDERVNDASFSPDGKRIVVACDNGLVQVFASDSGEKLLTLKGHDGDVNVANFNSDGTRIITGSDDRTARIWDAATGGEIAVLRDPIEYFSWASFAPDGEHILTLAHLVIAHVWTRIVVNAPAAGTIADSAVGVWHTTYGMGDDIPDDVARTMCIGSPIAVRSNGLIVILGGQEDIPTAQAFLTCKPDMTCQLFRGGPGEGSNTPLGDATVSFDGDKGQMCTNGRCEPIMRCPVITWTPEERASGLADGWEKQVLGK